MNIEPERVFANTFVFDEDDLIIGFDQTNPLSQHNGKVNCLKSSGIQGEIQIIGDGYSDFVMKKEGVADKFFAFTENVSRKQKKNNNLILTVEGFVVGVLTGIVGAGGGFLIIPALVLFANLPMKKAVATSLLIIAIKSLFGFLGDIGNDNLSFDWTLLSLFTTLSIVGIFFGTFLAKFINGNSLKKGFGWFVMLMSLIILFKEII